MTDENVKPQDYFAGFAEAPASDTMKWIDGLGYEHMTTIRAWSGTILYNEVAKFVAKVQETGGRTAALQPAPKPAQSPAPAPATANASGTSLAISKIKVTPEVKDGAARTLVELFVEGHQWADIKAYYNTGEAARVAFSPVTDLNFNEAGEYTINCIADYRLSEKKNTKGNPYKNLVAVRAA
jgi:hypothetical protein